MSSYFATQGVDYGRTGWITQKGEFIECSPLDHDKLLEELNLNIHIIEKKWIRISAMFGKNHIQFEGEKLTRSQHKALEDWDLVGWVTKGRVRVSTNFEKAYYK